MDTIHISAAVSILASFAFTFCVLTAKTIEAVMARKIARDLADTGLTPPFPPEYIRAHRHYRRTVKIMAALDDGAGIARDTALVAGLVLAILSMH